ncbi:ABC transporter ATP-binding protein [uncultured Paraglaciecola sp.]|uniref:ABC transporter ATP-binding protein n=1 Tax=uncultured Paraglaciecola sp. TaxID=1765024 RepID=UPI0030D81CE2|tara:strand:- start:82014 stop:82685 length:672 start_codon:yes stop_codon:yes gene_type:complete
MNNLIKLDNVYKSFGKKNCLTNALRGASLDVYSGEFVTIEGQSGSGKSTLLSIIGLLDKHDAGKYNLLDTDIEQLSKYQLSRLRNNNIGWIFQNFNLVNEFSVLENVLLPTKYNTTKQTNNSKEFAQELIQSVGMIDKLDSFPNELSGGQQQRVAIARALINKPDLILADEPTGNLDSENAKLIFQLLTKLHEVGNTIIMVTHSKYLAQQGEKKLTMQDGEFV